MQNSPAVGRSSRVRSSETRSRARILPFALHNHADADVARIGPSITTRFWGCQERVTESLSNAPAPFGDRRWAVGRLTRRSAVCLPRFRGGHPLPALGAQCRWQPESYVPSRGTALAHGVTAPREVELLGENGKENADTTDTPDITEKKR